QEQIGFVLALFSHRDLPRPARVNMLRNATFFRFLEFSKNLISTQGVNSKRLSAICPLAPIGGILPVTNGRFVKEQTGPDLDERPHSFSMSPNQAICSEKSIVFSPLAARALTIRSWPEALDARDLSRACMMASNCAACPSVLIRFATLAADRP